MLVGVYATSVDMYGRWWTVLTGHRDCNHRSKRHDRCLGVKVPVLNTAHYPIPADLELNVVQARSGATPSRSPRKPGLRDVR
jgi:hypothetical protein